MFFFFNIYIYIYTRFDHTPLVLSAFSFIPTATIFHFESFWLRYPVLSEVVSNAWSETTPVLDPVLRVQMKILQAQSAIKSWSLGLSSLIRQQSDICLFWIDWLDKAEEGRILCHVPGSKLRPGFANRSAAYTEIPV